jgi:hypothetical protein
MSVGDRKQGSRTSRSDLIGIGVLKVRRYKTGLSVDCRSCMRSGVVQQFCKGEIRHMDVRVDSVDRGILVHVFLATGKEQDPSLPTQPKPAQA